MNISKLGLLMNSSISLQSSRRRISSIRSGWSWRFHISRVLILYSAIRTSTCRIIYALFSATQNGLPQSTSVLIFEPRRAFRISLQPPFVMRFDEKLTYSTLSRWNLVMNATAAPSVRLQAPRLTLRRWINCSRLLVSKWLFWPTSLSKRFNSTRPVNEELIVLKSFSMAVDWREQLCNESFLRTLHWLSNLATAFTAAPLTVFFSIRSSSKPALRYTSRLLNMLLSKPLLSSTNVFKCDLWSSSMKILFCSGMPWRCRWFNDGLCWSMLLRSIVQLLSTSSAKCTKRLLRTIVFNEFPSLFNNSMASSTLSFVCSTLFMQKLSPEGEYTLTFASLASSSENGLYFERSDMSILIKLRNVAHSGSLL